MFFPRLFFILPSPPLRRSRCATKKKQRRPSPQRKRGTKRERKRERDSARSMNLIWKATVGGSARGSQSVGNYAAATSRPPLPEAAASASASSSSCYSFYFFLVAASIAMLRDRVFVRVSYTGEFSCGSEPRPAFSRARLLYFLAFTYRLRLLALLEIVNRTPGYAGC